ncbi:hypothetical protein C9374_004208 [Naegleria lovaniensis]|uniref:Uncharacterized protein n=1 Tax=Naegleria lovaniensis TaxID=51637 RepID=A0AA88KJS2_NAELO|nr:uncharacterized protein C9374_004208 [Naegleria lovaniensis]KAG2383537.1 hypothetical protein C9374_004208 [Naegleria lovaniensis]
MSTLSTKYVPHKLRPENIIDSAPRQATFPANQEHLKTALYASSVCIGEPESTKPCYDTTKGDDFDKVGTMLLETAMDRKLQIDKERENTDKYLHDLRGVHFEVGYSDRSAYLKSHKQESYQQPAAELFVQNKKDIVASGEGYNRGKSSIIKHIPDDWKQCLTTIARNDYISPEDQMKQNKQLGKEEIPRSRPTMEKSTVIAPGSS